MCNYQSEQCQVWLVDSCWKCSSKACLQMLWDEMTHVRACSWLCLPNISGIKGKLWATFVPAEAPAEGQRPRGASVVARDFQTVALYGSDGAFVGVRRPGSGKPIEVRWAGKEGM